MCVVAILSLRCDLSRLGDPKAGVDRIALGLSYRSDEVVYTVYVTDKPNTWTINFASLSLTGTPDLHAECPGRC